MSFLSMVLGTSSDTLVEVRSSIPECGERQLLLKVLACGVCRTDLHIVDGEVNAQLPIVPGHEIVATVEAMGELTEGFAIGDRVGVPWLGSTCGSCQFCSSGQENLCDRASFTGCHVNGGFAEYAVADYKYCFKLPPNYSDLEVAPLLCAGLIGWRSFKMSTSDKRPVKRLGLYGFGAAAHILIQVACRREMEVYVFTRSGDKQAQDFALTLGAHWVGDSSQMPPELLDAAIIFAPVGDLVPLALKAVRKGGTVVCGGIHMSEIPAFSYELLWGERKLCSVANLTRKDAVEFLEVAAKEPIKTTVVKYPLEKANQALADLRAGRINGAAVLVPGATMFKR